MTQTANPVTDHCHTHGWVRAILCRYCNGQMALVDRRDMPQAHLVEALIAIAGRCPDCPPVAIEELGAKKPRGELSSREVRERLADVVNAAIQGQVTYITSNRRRGAAVVPLAIADQAGVRPQA